MRVGKSTTRRKINILRRNINNALREINEEANKIALLLSEGYADIAITEDSDLLAYGCREVNSEF